MGKKARSSKSKRQKKKARKLSRYPLFRVLFLPRKERERIIPNVRDKDVVDFLAHIRSKSGVTENFDFPIPLVELIRHVGGTGLGMSRRFSEGDIVMLPSGHRVKTREMDGNEFWVHLPYTQVEDPERFFVAIDDARIKNKGTPIFDDLSDFWKRRLRRKVSRRNSESERALQKLLDKFRQGKTQANFVRLALKIGQGHAMYRGWNNIRIGTEVPVYVKDSDVGEREVGSRDLFLYGKRSNDGDTYEGISIEIESSFGTPSLKKMMYGLIKSVNVVDPRSNQEAKINLVHNIVLTPENKVQKKVRDLLKIDSWSKVKHEIDGLFDPEKIISRMQSKKSYLTEVLEHLDKSDLHKSILTEKERKIIHDTLEDVKKGKNFPQDRWDEIRGLINKVHKYNLDRLTIDFNVSDEIVNYLLGKPIKIDGKNIKPKYSHFLQYNTLLYFFSRGFKDSIKERVLKDLLLNDKNTDKLINAALSKKINENATLEISPIAMKEILDNMAKHMRKSLQNTVFYLTDSRGKKVKKIIMFKKVPEMYRLRPVVITPENKEWLAYLDELEVYRNELDKKIKSDEPITDIHDGRPVGRKLKMK